jgi:hypothetical protein
MLATSASDHLPCRIRGLEISPGVERAQQVRAQLPGQAARLGALDDPPFEVGVQFPKPGLRLPQRILRGAPRGHVGPLDEDPGDGARGILDRLVDEIHEARFRSAACIVRKSDFHVPGELGRAGREYLIEASDEALACKVRKRLARGPADDVAMPDEPPVGGIGQHEPVLGTMEQGREAR